MGDRVQMEERRSVKLSVLLVRYLLLCVMVCGFVLVVFILLFGIALSSGFVLPANAAEHSAQQARDALIEKGSFDATLIPPLCGYVLWDADGTVQQTSLSGQALRAAQQYYETGMNGSVRYHLSAPLTDGTCVIQFSIRMEYANPVLQRYLLRFESLGILLFVLSLLFALGGITLHYVRRFRGSLKPLAEATNAMAQGDLTWRAAPTGIAEYDDVLRAMQTLQTALEQSLQAQWNMEQSRVAQMQALAHDLRTPLTVIGGNAEFLGETPLTSEQTECVEAIVHAGESAQAYVAALRRIAVSSENKQSAPGESPTQEHPQSVRMTVQTDAFLQELVRDAHELCKVHRANLSVEGAETLPIQAVCLCAQDVRRAVGNLVQNAVEHSPHGGAVALRFAWDAPALVIAVEDSGGGFSAQALEHATQPLYTEHKGRTPEGHLGLGLSVASQTAHAHGGTLRVENTAEHHGLVTLTLVSQPSLLSTKKQ